MDTNTNSTGFGYERSRQQRLNNTAMEQFRMFLRQGALWMVVPLGVITLGGYWALSLRGHDFLILVTVCFAAMGFGAAGLAVYTYRRADDAVALETSLMRSLVATVLVIAVSAVVFASLV